MKLLFGWILLIVLILYTIYYIDTNTEKTVEIKDLTKISETAENTIYTAKTIKNDDKRIDLNIYRETEVIVVSGNKFKKDDKHKNDNINLTINRPNKNVILILNTKNKNSWIVKASKNTNINLIIFDKEYSEVLSKNEIYKITKKFEYFTNSEQISFVKMLNYLKEVFDINKINHLLYEEELSSEIIIDTLKNDPKYSLNYLKAKEIKKNFDFDLVSINKEFVKFNLNGPIFIEDKNKEILNDITFSPDKKKLYKITNNGLKIIDFTTKEELIKTVPGTIKIINPKGIAYDSLSDKVFIANAQGKFYIFDAISENWVSIRKYIDDFDINSLTYDEKTNTYISSTWKNEGLLFFDQNGNFSKRVNLEDKLEGINYYINKNEEIPQLQVIPNGEDYAIILANKFVEKIWYYNKIENKAYLTYNYYTN